MSLHWRKDQESLSLLNGIVFLAAFTARSQAYAQALRQVGLLPEWTLTFGDRNKDLAANSYSVPRQEAGFDLFMPNLRESLSVSINEAGWPSRHVPQGNVNDSEVVSQLKALNPKLVIYSGYGGQLVSADTLDCGAPFLHMHAGWLPDYRGSTTVYYSWLEGNDCGVSALLLDPDIDKGPLVARRRYPSPPNGIDVDLIYDNAIRADLLVRVLVDFCDHGKLSLTDQPQDSGETYFVIHPVLKHIALLSGNHAGES
jgi:methionyl-tRNA formyltransferase